MNPVPRLRASRTVADDAGARWIVFEECALPHQRRHLPRAPGWEATGWLVFRSVDGAERRILLPPRWRSVTDDALRALLTAAAMAETP